MTQCRRTGSRTAVRAARLPALLTATALVVAACSGSGTHGTASTTPTVATPPPSSPSAPPTPGPVASPTATPSVVDRKVTIPAGAKDPGFNACVVSDIVETSIETDIFNNPDRAEQEQKMTGLGDLAGLQKPDVVASRKGWLAAGWPAGSPIVQDLDVVLSGYTELQAAAKTSDVDAIPAIYLKLSTAFDQYNHDINSTKTLCR